MRRRGEVGGELNEFESSKDAYIPDGGRGGRRGVLACLAKTRRLSDTVPQLRVGHIAPGLGYTLRQPIYPPTYLI